MNPFTQNPALSVASIGEIGLINRIHSWLGEATPPSPRGMGDDCAVTEVRANLLTCDSLVYLRHFDDSATAELVGAKLLKRNISDVAAMGGIPCDAVVALFLPKNTSLEWIEGFTRGMAKCALDYSTSIVGGDVAEGPTLSMTMTLTGRARRPLTRASGAAGDMLFVSGPLGGSIQGHHLTFTPRVEQGMFLSMTPEVTSCMDLSDGLAKDAPSLAGENLVAVLDVDSIPPSNEVLDQCEGKPKEIAAHVIGDGEDYELLFTVKAEAADAFEKAWESRFGGPVFRIGRLEQRASGGPRLIDSATGKALEYHGYEHLR